jgi:hypothetical protein
VRWPARGLGLCPFVLPKLSSNYYVWSTVKVDRTPFCVMMTQCLFWLKKQTKLGCGNSWHQLVLMSTTYSIVLLSLLFCATSKREQKKNASFTSPKQYPHTHFSYDCHSVHYNLVKGVVMFSFFIIVVDVPMYVGFFQSDSTPVTVGKQPGL